MVGELVEIRELFDGEAVTAGDRIERVSLADRVVAGRTRGAASQKRGELALPDRQVDRVALLDVTARDPIHRLQLVDG